MVTQNPLFIPASLQRRRTTSTEQQAPAKRVYHLPQHHTTLRNTFLLKQWLHTYTRIWLHGGIVWPIAFVLWQLLFQRVVDVACGWVYLQLAVRTHSHGTPPHCALQGYNNDVASCTNVRSGGYWTPPHASNKRLLAAWSMLFDGVLISAVAPMQLTAMYGAKVSRTCILAVSVGAVAYAALHTAAWALWGWPLSDVRLGVITAIAWAYSVVVSGSQFAYILHDAAAGWRWVGMHFVAYVPARLYLQLLPMYGC